jgi:hypothetical protein
MADVQDTNRGETNCWLELANGGGVMFRDPTAAPPSEPQYARRRQPKRLESHAAPPPPPQRDV